mmetsp:Transcript_26462/g.84811  ORF Transcript_26462/g.84811 Transcript_26462/m.84811 type:complete len:469 (-) Transcript_26462:95-1501(-)
MASTRRPKARGRGGGLRLRGGLGAFAALEGAERVFAVDALAVVGALDARLVALAVPLDAAALLAVAANQVHRAVPLLPVAGDADAWLEGVRLLLLHCGNGGGALLPPLLGRVVVLAALAHALGGAEVADGKADAVALEAARLVAAALYGLSLLLLLPLAALARARRRLSPLGLLLSPLVHAAHDELAQVKVVVAHLVKQPLDQLAGEGREADSVGGERLLEVALGRLLLLRAAARRPRRGRGHHLGGGRVARAKRVVERPLQVLPQLVGRIGGAIGRGGERRTEQRAHDAARLHRPVRRPHRRSRHRQPRRAVQHVCQLEERRHLGGAAGGGACSCPPRADEVGELEERARAPIREQSLDLGGLERRRGHGCGRRRGLLATALVDGQLVEGRAVIVEAIADKVDGLVALLRPQLRVRGGAAARFGGTRRRRALHLWLRRRCGGRRLLRRLRNHRAGRRGHRKGQGGPA